MKKTASIILLLVLLFNIVGYRAWFYYAEQKADAAFESKLDKDQYDETDLVSITVPLNNPYLTDDAAFERVDGEISFEGRTLKYVKRKVVNGKLTVLCIPDTRKMVMKKAKLEYANNDNDLSGAGRGSSKSGVQKSFILGDYETPVSFNQIHHVRSNMILWSSVYPFSISSVYLTAPGKPPRA